MGAWIETALRFAEQLCLSSLPTWGRGLKRVFWREVPLGLGSLPTWGRGLKQREAAQEVKETQVAPYMGAWIETSKYPRRHTRPRSRSLHGGVD